MNNWNWFFKIENFSLLYLLVYLIFSLLMIPLFGIEVFSFFFVKLFFILALGLYLGIKCSQKFFSYLNKEYENISQKLNVQKTPEQFALKLICFTPFVTIILSWMCILTRFLKSHEINHNLFSALRSQMILNPRSLLPVYLSYINGLIFFSVMYRLLKFSEQKNKFTFFHLFFSILFLFLNDLMSFGRVGILFLIYMAVGLIYIKRIPIFRIKTFFIGLASLCLLMLPKLIRGNFQLFQENSGFSSYLTPHFKWIPPSLLDIYVYYFAPPYALSEMFKTDFFSNHTFGARIFTPMANALSHVFHKIQSGQLQDPFLATKQSFYGNIYTVIRDYYADFGTIGVFIIPFILGFFFNFFFQKKNIYADILKLIFFIWLFSIPIYHVFMLGSILLCTAVAILFYFLSQRTALSQG